MNKEIGIVVIGRNEGERLKRCLHSALSETNKIVYIDSGSSDNSVPYARSTGVEVVKLQTSTPFSAGRARNEGFWFLIHKYPQLRFVQFIDGDCELCKGWISSASQYLKSHPSCAVNAGHTRERFPENSIYNLLCDVEWNTPVGETRSCGGNFIVVTKAFTDVEGFNPSVVAGEEPELCYRLRQKGWKIYKLDHPMVLHDANMTRFSEWLKRAVRSGYAYAQGVAMHGRGPEKYNVRQSISIWIWAAGVPISALYFTWPKLWISFIIIGFLYMLLMVKIAISLSRRDKILFRTSMQYGFFIVIGKIPQLYGQIKYWRNRFLK